MPAASSEAHPAHRRAGRRAVRSSYGPGPARSRLRVRLRTRRRPRGRGGRGRGRRGGRCRAAILTPARRTPDARLRDDPGDLGPRQRHLPRKPSPGSVYPTLQLLVDEGLIAPAESRGQRPRRPSSSPTRDAWPPERSRPRRGDEIAGNAGSQPRWTSRRHSANSSNAVGQSAHAARRQRTAAVHPGHSSTPPVGTSTRFSAMTQHRGISPRMDSEHPDRLSGACAHRAPDRGRRLAERLGPATPTPTS